mmetsp:Transcript_560/g.1287  ORF Transcript_560/g.1287 Transcript_560/m.1287 type:complete len:241 (+) Transcript_560:2080-2802(+)
MVPRHITVDLPDVTASSHSARENLKGSYDFSLMQCVHGTNTVNCSWSTSTHSGSTASVRPDRLVSALGPRTDIFMRYVVGFTSTSTNSLSMLDLDSKTPFFQYSRGFHSSDCMKRVMRRDRKPYGRKSRRYSRTYCSTPCTNGGQSKVMSLFLESERSDRRLGMKILQSSFRKHTSSKLISNTSSRYCCTSSSNDHTRVISCPSSMPSFTTLFGSSINSTNWRFTHKGLVMMKSLLMLGK